MFTTSFSCILEQFRQAHATKSTTEPPGTFPSPLSLKQAGTLRYKKEICYVMTLSQVAYQSLRKVASYSMAFLIKMVKVNLDVKLVFNKKKHQLAYPDTVIQLQHVGGDR